MPFWNAFDGQQAAVATLRVGQFSLLWLASWIPFGIPMSLRFQWYPFRPLPTGQKLILLLPLYGLATPVLAIWGKFQAIDLAHYGLVIDARLFWAFWQGLGLGLLSLTVLFTLEYLWGWIVLNVAPSPTAASVPAMIAQHSLLKLGRTIGLYLGLLLLCSGISFIEELLFRGFLWTELQAGCGWIMAAIATSLIFALLHLVWDGWQARSQVWGLMVMGLVLCTARWADQQQLGLAWGLHTGWIWAVASLDQGQILQLTATAPLPLTGKPGQPLTGWLTGLLLLITGLGLWFYAVGSSR